MTNWTEVPKEHPVWVQGEKGKFYFLLIERDGRFRIIGGNHKFRSRSVDPSLVTLRTTRNRPASA